jgi:hypothetical protein
MMAQTVHRGLLTVFRASKFRFTLSAHFKDERTGEEIEWDRAPKAFETINEDPHKDAVRVELAVDDYYHPTTVALLEGDDPSSSQTEH